MHNIYDLKLAGKIYLAIDTLSALKGENHDQIWLVTLAHVCNNSPVFLSCELDARFCQHSLVSINCDCSLGITGSLAHITLPLLYGS